MNRSGLMTVTAVAVAFCAGLGWSYYVSQGSGGGVAVVDLDRVARELGRDTEMVSSINTRASALNTQLKTAQQSAVQQLGGIKDKLGENPDVEAQKQYVLAQRSASLQLNKLRQQAGQQVGQHKVALVKKFREDAKPVALQVAQSRGFSAIATTSDLFHYDSTNDITDDVIKLMSAESPAKPVVHAAAQAQPAQAQSATAPAAPAQTATAPTTATR